MYKLLFPDLGFDVYIISHKFAPSSPIFSLTFRFFASFVVSGERRTRLRCSDSRRPEITAISNICTRVCGLNILQAGAVVGNILELIVKSTNAEIVYGDEQELFSSG